MIDDSADGRPALRSLSIDYTGLVGDPLLAGDWPRLGAAMMDEWLLVYRDAHGDSMILEFSEGGAHFVFDLAQGAGIDREDRTVGAWTLTPERVGKRDVTYQRGYPMAAAEVGRPPVDRGHLIPHLSGGEFGPNIFRQDRALNRGWSEAGKRYRAIEREAARHAGTLYFGHLIYADDSAHPVEIEIGYVRADGLRVERFVNRPELVR